jgi:hypothetical protein
MSADDLNDVRSEISYVVSDFLANLITTNLLTLALCARRVKLRCACPPHSSERVAETVA